MGTRVFALVRSIAVREGGRVIRPAALVLAAVLLAACAPPLRVQSAEGVALIDVRKNGEPTAISSIILFNSHEARMVWHLVSDRGDHYRMRTLQLRTGPNPAAPQVFEGKVRAQVPHGQSSFVLQPGVLYRVHACAPVAYGGCRSVEFKL